MHDESSDPLPEELQAALDANDSQAIVNYFSKITPAAVRHSVSYLSASDQARLLQSLSDEAAAEVVDHLPDAQAAQMIERLSPARAVRSPKAFLRTRSRTRR